MTVNTHDDRRIDRNHRGARQYAASDTAPPSETLTLPHAIHRGRWACLSLAALVIVSGCYLQWRRTGAIFTEAGVVFADPDDAMRLVRVRKLLNEPGRRVGRIAEINWPAGAELHWTAPMDWLLAGAYKLARPLVRTADPLATVGAWTPVLLGAIYVGLMMFFLHRAFGCPVAVLAGLFVVVSDGFDRAFALGHPDHHGLMELLFLIAIGCWIPRVRPDGSRGASSRQTAILSGAATGLAIWIATQSMLFWAFILAGICFASFHASPDERPGWAARLREFSAAVLTVVAIGYLWEHWPSLYAVAVDRISLVHVALTAMAFLVPTGSPTRRAAAVWLRRGPILLAGLAAIIAWLYVERGEAMRYVSSPAFLRWSTTVAELQPLLARAGGDWSLNPAVRRLGYAPIVLLPLIYPFVRCRSIPCGAKLTLALSAIVVTGLAVVQRRWLDHVNVALAPVLAVGAWEVARWALTRIAVGGAAAQCAVTTLILAAACAPSARTVLTRETALPDIQELRAAYAARRINAYQAAGKLPPLGPRAILASDGDGPSLLYRTGLPVVATPYHRAIDGLLEGARFFSERDPAAARAQLDRLGVRYIVVPFRTHEQLMHDEWIVYGELRSFDPPREYFDETGDARAELRYRPAAFETMAYRLAIAAGKGIPGVEQIAVSREGAETENGFSGLVYVVHPMER